MASVSTSLAPYQCSTCNLTTPVKPKNLVVFIDGTSNKPDDKSTNVVKLFEKVRVIRGSIEGSELEQDKRYLRGIGAYDMNHLGWLGRKRKEMYSALEMAFAWNAEKNIKEAYTWLAKTYQEGSRIYLFGFSRGAYQVRALASVIHEVGLVMKEEDTDTAYNHYLAIDPYEPKTRNAATNFKEKFCWKGVRIHFVGVWDTVSSLGFIKRDVHVTASASVTNACHFRHALALDERRVKFMPEYFLETNAHHGKGNPRNATKTGDVKEVWFAGSHSDVGGADRPTDQLHDTLQVIEKENAKPHVVHAGNVPLLWMKREAAANGLVFGQEEFSWVPEDVEFGRRDSMSFVWRIVEILPVRHQVSFSGTGIHRPRWHLFRPRPVIPNQQIHPSILSGDAYRPCADLRGGIDIPTTRTPNRLWSTEAPDEETATSLLSSLLSDHKKALESLEQVLFLLDSEKEQIQSIPRLPWSGTNVGQSDLANFALAIINDVISGSTVLDPEKARTSLSAILSSPEHLDIYKTLYTLRFSARHEKLRRRFIDHDEVIRALIFALEWTSRSPRECLFLLVIDSLCHLINDNQLRGKVIQHLGAMSGGAGTAQSRFSVVLEVKSPNKLTASLRMIGSLARHEPGLCDAIKPRIYALAAKGRGPVGSAAVKVLVALNMWDKPENDIPLNHDIHISNILGYLDNILPRLDAEVGTASSADNIDHDGLPPIPLVNGSGELDEKVMQQLVSTINSYDAHERIVAIFTLLKLCRYPIIRQSFSQLKVLHIFMRQLKQKGTSLLAAYALMTCVKYDKIERERGGHLPLLIQASDDDFHCAAQSIINMLDKGWLDDAVGRIQGRDIFDGLMTSAYLREQAIGLGIIASLMKKFEVGKLHEVRMGLICLDILAKENLPGLARFVDESVKRLKDKNKKVQKKGVKILAALAQTSAGEEAIKPHLIEIVKMLLPSSGPSCVPRSRLFGPAAALYDLSKNETLRQKIKAFPEFDELRHLYTGTP